jgi:DNA-binding transcriptional LysR family regulator
VTTDLDLRKLRYFVAVAEELNFGRAAARLHVAQPVLSRQIRAFEAEVGRALFVRDHRGTQLTDAGKQLLADASSLLGLAEGALRRVTTAGGTFTVSFMPGLVPTPVNAAFVDRHPQTTVEVLRTDWADQAAVLHDGRADVGLVRFPIDTAGLRLRTVAEEPRMALLPATHPLAGKEQVELRDLADDRLLQDPNAVPEWTFASRGAGYRSVEEKLEHVAAGEGVVILPASTAGFYRRPDVVPIPVTDLPPGAVAVAWDAHRTDPLVLDYVELAAEILGADAAV